MNLFVFDYDMNYKGMLENYESAIWTTDYYGFGDFELYLRVTTEALKLLKPDRLIARDRDITTSGSTSTCSKIMIIESREITTDVDEGDHLRIKGRELSAILERRIIWGQQTFSDKVEDVIMSMITNNAISTTDTKRQFANLVCSDERHIDDTIECQHTGDNLGSTIIELCQTYYLGHRIVSSWTRKNGKVTSYEHKFETYQGTDRTITSGEISERVIFSEKNENIYNTDLISNESEYKSVALVGGEGEGSERRYQTVELEENTGVARRELFVDARDVSSNDEMTETEYNNLLKARGAEKLSETFSVTSFSADLAYNAIYKFGEDFDLGDKVSVMIKYIDDTYYDTRITGMIECDNSDGYSIVPQFDYED